MPEITGDRRGAEVTQADLTGARFRKVRLIDADLRMVDLSGAVLRDVSLAGATIDGSELDGLRIDGVEVAPLVEAELTRRHPGRALRRAADPDGLRAAWAALERTWAATYDRVAALPAGTVDVSVRGEWTFAQTLRHLVFATDGWLGAGILGEQRPFHPWGVPFSEYAEFTDPAGIGVDPAAAPAYPEVLELRAGRMARVREFLAGVSPERLEAECGGPPWEGDNRFTVLRCLWVILNEEWAHHGFAERDLDVLAARTDAG